MLLYVQNKIFSGGTVIDNFNDDMTPGRGGYLPNRHMIRHMLISGIIAQ